MRVLYLSDLDLSGSGYSHITINVCQGLAEKGHEVKALTFSYKNEQHPWDFSIFPVKAMPDAMAYINNLNFLWKPHILITAMDIPQQTTVLDNVMKFQLPYIGITPLESDPLCLEWATSLMRARQMYFISEFGTNEAIKMGVPAQHLPVGIDTGSWKKRTKKDYKEARKKLFGIEDDTFVILTVADNHERKNLAGCMQSVSMMKERMGDDFKFRYVLVTRQESVGGWRLIDLSRSLGIGDEVVLFERGLTFAQMWLLYASSDVFFLGSKGEGLGMPVMESQAVGVPVVASSVGAIPEHISNNRGYAVPHEYEMIDPYGNATRYYMNKFIAANQLELVAIGAAKPRVSTVVKNGRKYVESRQWSKAVDVIDEGVRSFGHAEETQEQKEADILPII